MSKARPMVTPVVKLTQAQIYAIIRSPVITEKATLMSSHRQVAFRVPLEATKPEIKAAVEDSVQGQGDRGQHAAPGRQEEGLPGPAWAAQRLQEGDGDPGRGPYHRRDDGSLMAWR